MKKNLFLSLTILLGANFIHGMEKNLEIEHIKCLMHSDPIKAHELSAVLALKTSPKEVADLKKINVGDIIGKVFFLKNDQCKTYIANFSDSSIYASSVLAGPAIGLINCTHSKIGRNRTIVSIDLPKHTYDHLRMLYKEQNSDS